MSNATLVLGAGGSIASSTVILNGAGGSVLDASAVGGIALPAGYVLAASGGIGGNVAATNSLITPGTNGTVGTLTCSNNLSLNGVTIPFDLSSSPASGNDQVVVGGALNLSGVNTIQITPLTLLGVGTYKLFVCGSVSGTLGNLSLTGSPGAGFNAVLNVTGTEVDLIVTAVTGPPSGGATVCLTSGITPRPTGAAMASHPFMPMALLPFLTTPVPIRRQLTSRLRFLRPR